MHNTVATGDGTDCKMEKERKTTNGKKERERPDKNKVSTVWDHFELKHNENTAVCQFTIAFDIKQKYFLSSYSINC